MDKNLTPILINQKKPEINRLKKKKKKKKIKFKNKKQ